MTELRRRVELFFLEVFVTIMSSGELAAEHSPPSAHNQPVDFASKEGRFTPASPE